MKELDKVSLRKCPVGVLVCGFADVFLITYLFMCLTLHVLFWQGYHTKPDALNALVNVLLAYSKKDDSYHIETINYPLPLNSKQRVTSLA